MESLSPFLWGSCIPYNMPVYPGAQRIIAGSRQKPKFRSQNDTQGEGYCFESSHGGAILSYRESPLASSPVHRTNSNRIPVGDRRAETSTVGRKAAASKPPLLLSD